MFRQAISILTTVAISMLVAHMPSAAAWHRAETENFVVIADMGESSIREYALELERFDRLMRRFTPSASAPSPVKLRIFVVRDIRDVEEHSYQGVDGFYRPELRGPYSVVPRRNTPFGPFQVRRDEVVLHEYVHHFLMQYVPAAYPAWYEEGIAELYSTVRFHGDNRVDVGRPSRSRANLLGLYLRAGIWMPMESMLSNQYANNALTYSEGWLIVHRAMFDTELRGDLNAYLASVNDGRSGIESYREHFGDWDPSLDRILIDYFAGGRFPYVPMEVDLGQIPEPIVRSLSDAERDVELLYAMPPALLREEIGEVLEEQPSNPQAHAEHARLLIATQNYDAAIAAADRALAIDPDHVDANINRGLATMEAIYQSNTDIIEVERENSGQMALRDFLRLIRDLALAEAGDAIADDPRWEEARSHFLRANRADPYSSEALFYYFVSFPRREERPDNAMAALEQAFNLIPQAPVTRMTLGREYIFEGRYSEARRIVEPVANNPHISTGKLVSALYSELAQREVGFDQVDAVLDEIATEIERINAEREAAEETVAAQAEEEAQEPGNDATANEIDTETSDDNSDSDSETE